MTPPESSDTEVVVMEVLVVDDLRSFPFPATYARTSVAGLELLERPGGWDEVWLDHDLGGDDTTIPVLDRMCELAHGGHPVELRRVVVHTSNPPGRDVLRRSLERWGYRVVVVDAAACGAFVAAPR